MVGVEWRERVWAMLGYAGMGYLAVALSEWWARLLALVALLLHHTAMMLPPFDPPDREHTFWIDRGRGRG